MPVPEHEEQYTDNKEHAEAAKVRADSFLGAGPGMPLQEEMQMKNMQALIQLPGACDCHLHVIGPKKNYPLSPKRVYTPVDAPLDDLQKMHERLGIERKVLIQTSIFGYDNSCLFDALKLLGSQARGVAVAADNTPEAILEEMNQLGVRGLRLNLATYGASNTKKISEQLKNVVSMCEPRLWHTQIFTSSDVVAAVAHILRELPIPVVLDHFALLPLRDSIGNNEKVLAELLENGNVWVKISAPYRLGAENNDFSDPLIGKLARRLYRYNPNRIVWGTDWPHTPIHGHTIGESKEEPYRNVDTGALLTELLLWFPDRKDQERILVENPAQLYGF